MLIFQVVEYVVWWMLIFSFIIDKIEENLDKEIKEELEKEDE